MTDEHQTTIIHSVVGCSRAVAIIGEAFDEENIIRRKIRKRALQKGRPLLQDKKR